MLKSSPVMLKSSPKISKSSRRLLKSSTQSPAVERISAKFTKIDKVDQDSENPVNLNGPKSTKIVPVSQNEPKVSQDLPKLMELTNIART